MRKHGGTPSRRDKHVTLAAISPPGVARGRFVGGQQSGLAGSKPPPLFTREASSCSSQGRRQGEPWGASPRPSAPTYLPTLCSCQIVRSRLSKPPGRRGVLSCAVLCRAVLKLCCAVPYGAEWCCALLCGRCTHTHTHTHKYLFFLVSSSCGLVSDNGEHVNNRNYKQKM